MFNINIVKFVYDFLPIVLRKTKILSLFLSLISPFERLKNEFILFVEITRYNLKITGQTIVMQSFLNKKFDNNLQRIFISQPQEDSFYAWFEAENQTNNFLGFQVENITPTNYLYFQNENQTAFNFTINVPLDLQNVEAKIKANVNTLKLAGKKYQIIYF